VDGTHLAVTFGEMICFNGVGHQIG
jgi:hypothetical protein